MSVTSPLEWSLASVLRPFPDQGELSQSHVSLCDSGSNTDDRCFSDSVLFCHNLCKFFSDFCFFILFSCLSHWLTSHKKQIGITGTQTLKYQAINSVIGLIAEALIMLFVDKLGRRTIIIWGNLAMCCTFIVSTILLARFPPSAENTGAHWGFIIMTWIFNFTFASMGSLCKKPPKLWMNGKVLISFSSLDYTCRDF